MCRFKHFNNPSSKMEHSLGWQQSLKETTANLRCLNGMLEWGDVCDYLVHLTVGSISNNFNQLKDASWILGYKRTLWSPISSNEIETWEGSIADLESIKIYFVQRTVDIGGTVGHCCSMRCADLLPVTKCYPQLSKSSGQWHSPSPRANVEDLVHDEWEGQGNIWCSST